MKKEMSKGLENFIRKNHNDFNDLIPDKRNWTKISNALENSNNAGTSKLFDDLTNNQELDQPIADKDCDL